MYKCPVCEEYLLELKADWYQCPACNDRFREDEVDDDEVFMDEDECEVANG